MDSTQEDGAIESLRTPALFSSLTGDGVHSASCWMLIATGILTAAAFPYAFCGSLLPASQPLHQPLLRWAMAFFHASVSLALTAAAGAVDVWLLWRVLSTKPALLPGSLSRHALVGWIFLPAIVLLDREQSNWLLPLVILATVATAVSLRRIFPSAAITQTHAPAHAPGELPSLYGLPHEDLRPLHTFFIAICAQTSLLLACTGALALAGTLLIASVALLIWRWNPLPALPPRRSLSGMVALALLITVLAQLPWIDRRLRPPSGSRSPHRSPRDSALAHRYDSNYVGIVLWPPPRKQTEIHPPMPRDAAFRAGALAKPLVIPFDGAYWYFQAPRNEPGPQAHIAHGKPTDAGINLRSTNEGALLMEAHQTLAKAIDPRCCREIDVTLANADTLSGRIILGMRLSDSTSPKQPPLLLGVQALPSSAVTPIPANRPPVQETLRFPIAPSASRRRFDKISIFFLREHIKRGAKVEIQSFTLIPR
ncbi:MAG TPA: hypothetical protein VNW54_16070 [Granulicella sp.]|nr:hypothetical protein [Granulicella sp.]